ncbi:beta-L-arabinofuranosidase domain-containing protein [Mucilaginibacter sp.]|uniref:beta-L-arabinofuranosidase domain-containing protein n=1 Tax=Mucilaginibacter sp. TaxID=1882438 RepID=UPI002ED59049
MKKIYRGIVIAALYSFSLNTAIAQTGYVVKDKVAKQVSQFNLSDVRLLDGPFKHAMEKDGEWLLSLQPDRFLHRFRENAGLKPKAEIYGGWETGGVSGHSLGHYLSACSMMYAASGDTRFKQKTDYIIAELAECQRVRKTGYIGAIPGEDKLFDEIAAGDIRSPGFDLNGAWVPWYTEHKILAGLVDTYLYTGNQQAKQVAIKFCDWIDAKFKNLTEAQFQLMLECEHGGMNEALANVYAITGNKKYLDLSYRFHHKRILDPLAQQQDDLAGLHANTQIPKIIGCARQYELTGNPADHNIANFFWNTVVNHYSYVIGGNSDHERFSDKPDHLSTHLSSTTTETCNSYNMLKLTGYLFGLDPQVAYMDYYERVLYNHILASQNPENGMVLYYLTLAPGTQKQFGTPNDSFWCCTGTGMENHSKYGMDIYDKDSKGGLYLNLFIPSTLNWKEKGMQWTMETSYPESGVINFTLTQSARNRQMPLHIRYPKWAVNGVQLTVNGKAVAVTAKPGSYITLNRIWRKGDKVKLSYAMSLYTESMPDNKNVKAFLYGPLVLAGELGRGDIKKRDIPVFVASNPDLTQWIKPVADKPTTFYASNLGKQVMLEPLYKIYDQKQAVYWDFFNNEEWKLKQQQFDAERKAEDELAANTLDQMRIGEMQPERDHNFKGENTHTGEVEGARWRDATDGGWFSFQLDTKGAATAQLQCKYFGADGEGREFEILVDGQKIATEKLVKKASPDFYSINYVIPPALLAGKQSIVVKFQALPGKTAGGLFGCRLLKMK